MATDKLPLEKYARPGYALKLAQLLGQAAASSMIVGRALEAGKRPVFDDGDEVVREGEDGLPTEITGGRPQRRVWRVQAAAGDLRRPLRPAGQHPRQGRARSAGFATAYLDAFREQFLHIQGDYRKRRRAFDTLFKHCKYDPGGSFAYRWECVLRRLDQTNPCILVEAVRQHIWALNRQPAQPANAPQSIPAEAAKP